MRGFLVTALAVLLAAFVFAAPKPAAALPAGAALDYNHANSDLVEVKKYKYGYRGRYYRPYRYARPYYYRPYYRPYYYRPYPYYYRPYWRPGFSIWFGW